MNKILIAALSATLILSTLYTFNMSSQQQDEQVLQYSKGKQGYNPKIEFQSHTYYVWDRSWPAATCMDRKCTPSGLMNYDGKSMNQHGLWPSGEEGDQCAQPTFCTDRSYNESVLNDDVKSWMDERYVGLYSSSKKFRQHEYEKHGACMAEAENLDTDEKLENFYFGKIEEVDTKYNVIEALEKKGVVPDENKEYSLEDFTSALKEAWGEGEYDLDLKCMSFNKVQHFAGLKMYLDLDYNPVEKQCVKKPKNQLSFTQAQPCNANKAIIFPPFKK